jgi:dimethylargininase
MQRRFTRALLRPPASTYATGLTTATDGPPVLATALDQHCRYAAALEACGLTLTILPADTRFPDGCFIEDTAVLARGGAIVTRPGAPSRAGETESVAAVLSRSFGTVSCIEAPGTVDGGDVCETDDGFLIGVSARTNEAGAGQLAGLLKRLGCAAALIDIRRTPALLHLKTGISYLGDGRLAVAPDLPALPAFARYERVAVTAEERYAANCVRINDRVVVAAGYPRFAERLAALGLDPLPLEMSEFRKMDGGLSCLSLRY